MKNITFFFLLFFSALSCSKQEGSVIKLQLDGVDYKQVYMSCQLLGMDEKTVINGIKEGINTWAFPVSDSIFNYTDYYSFRYAQTDTTDGKSYFGTSYDINFKALHDGDTISVSQLTMDRKLMKYHAKYMSHKTFENTQGEFLIQIIETDNFLIPYTENTEFEIAGKNSSYCLFYDYKKQKELPYDEGLRMYIETAKQHPESRFLISRLNSFKSRLKSKEDLTSLYNAFSEENKNSPFGQNILLHINTYLSSVDFQNTTLPKWDTEEPEDIIQDKSKNALIVFSASWCGPCKAQIPLLKDTYADLKDKLNIVYVSIDERKTVDAWREEMKSQEIPWRSVLAADNLNEIKKKYFVNAGIPHSLLYRADNGKMEVVDIRKEEDKEKVYRLSK